MHDGAAGVQGVRRAGDRRESVSGVLLVAVFGGGSWLVSAVVAVVLARGAEQGGMAMDWIRQNWVELTAALGLIAGGARLVIKLTPTQADDTAWARFVEPVLKFFGLVVEPRSGAAGPAEK